VKIKGKVILSLLKN